VVVGGDEDEVAGDDGNEVVVEEEEGVGAEMEDVDTICVAAGEGEGEGATSMCCSGAAVVVWEGGKGGRLMMFLIRWADDVVGRDGGCGGAGAKIGDGAA
jgi:hypothetical protein